MRNIIALVTGGLLLSGGLKGFPDGAPVELVILIAVLSQIVSPWAVYWVKATGWKIWDDQGLPVNLTISALIHGLGWLVATGADFGSLPLFAAAAGIAFGTSSNAVEVGRRQTRRKTQADVS